MGGGRAATLHAEATRALPGGELIGVGGRPGSAPALAAAMGVPDLSLEALAAAADGLVLAVPPDAVDAITADLPPGLAVLVELPLRAARGDVGRAVVAVNLLHASTVKKALRAIADLGPVHHLTLRGRAPRREEATDIFAEPFAGAWPVLLAAAGAAVTTVSAIAEDRSAKLKADLADGRQMTAALEWSGLGEDALTEIEAAGQSGVVNCTLWPLPALEIDGRAVAAHDEHPIIALGFVEQMRRFAAVCDGRAEPWPPLSVGHGVTALTEAANLSAGNQGKPVNL